MRVLFWVPYPTEGPSNRFRIEQYLPYLRENNILCSVRPFWERDVYKILYEEGHYLKKIFYFLKGALKRLKDVIDLSGYDLVFVHREAFPIGAAFLERIAAGRKPIIYDFDDSVFLSNSSGANKFVRILKNHRKIPGILRLSSYVIVGNSYLGGYAAQYNKNVAVISTAIDINKYSFNLRSESAPGTVVIGWIGTYSTNKYLSLLGRVFLRLTDKYPGSVEIRLVGCRKIPVEASGVSCRSWSLSAEIAELQGFDIGIMPVWDDEWTRGKCAFKIIQYMATGAAVVASPVGMNREIINDGENGFLATDEESWFRKLCLLIENPDLRGKFALAGRATIENRYSLGVTAPKLLAVLKDVSGKCQG